MKPLAYVFIVIVICYLAGTRLRPVKPGEPHKSRPRPVKPY